MGIFDEERNFRMVMKKDEDIKDWN